MLPQPNIFTQFLHRILRIVHLKHIEIINKNGRKTPLFLFKLNFLVVLGVLRIFKNNKR